MVHRLVGGDVIVSGTRTVGWKPFARELHESQHDAKSYTSEEVVLIFIWDNWNWEVSTFEGNLLRNSTCISFRSHWCIVMYFKIKSVLDKLCNRVE